MESSLLGAFFVFASPGVEASVDGSIVAVEIRAERARQRGKKQPSNWSGKYDGMMIQRVLRPLWPLLMVALVFWFSVGVADHFGRAPGEQVLSGNAAQLAAEAAGGSSISIGGFLKDTLDPWVLGLALLATLVLSKWSGFLSAIRFAFGSLTNERTPVSDPAAVRQLLTASKALTVAGRSILWGTCLFNAVYVATLPWFGKFPEWDRWRYVRGMYSRESAVAMLILGPLFLMSLARRARNLANTHGGAGQSSKPFGTALGRAIDVLSVLGIVACLYLQTLVTFKAQLIGTDPKGHLNATFHSPSFESVSVDLLIWSAVFVAVFSVLACFPKVTGFLGHVDWRQLGFNALVSGALGAFVLYHSAVVYFLRGGGQGDPQVMGQVGGLMLVPLCVGAVFYLPTRFWGTAKATDA